MAVRKMITVGKEQNSSVCLWITNSRELYVCKVPHLLYTSPQRLLERSCSALPHRSSVERQSNTKHTLTSFCRQQAHRPLLSFQPFLWPLNRPHGSWYLGELNSIPSVERDSDSANKCPELQHKHHCLLAIGKATQVHFIPQWWVCQGRGVILVFKGELETAKEAERGEREMEKGSEKEVMEHACKCSHMLDLEGPCIMAVRLWGSQHGVVFLQRERGRESGKRHFHLAAAGGQRYLNVSHSYTHRQKVAQAAHMADLMQEGT
ncbi:Nuclear factor 1 B-type [Triplophysa tibetana]|uniref:Nuclear factor 1 B-type n=1 Tax=Triplophysa tibetana TaxID=1572043 RepID=A0A5A9PSJ2_9TELE|nr:Nuclear factor 1 B-type [Triplophysa tibetana]